MEFLLASFVTVSCPNVDNVTPSNWKPGDLVAIGFAEKGDFKSGDPIIIRIKNGDKWEIYNHGLGRGEGYESGYAGLHIRPSTKTIEYELETSRCKIRGELNSYYSPPTPKPK